MEKKRQRRTVLFPQNKREKKVSVSQIHGRQFPVVTAVVCTDCTREARRRGTVPNASPQKLRGTRRGGKLEGGNLMAGFLENTGLTEQQIGRGERASGRGGNKAQ